MIASPALLLTGIIYGFDEPVSNRVTGLLGLIFVLGWMCSAVGIRLHRATGRGRAARALFILQMIGLLLAASQQVQEMVFEQPEANGLVYTVADMAWPLSMLMMLLVGSFVLKAGVWRGWRRWSVILCGLALPLFLGVGALLGRRLSVIFFGVLTTLLFMLLGYAVRTVP